MIEGVIRTRVGYAGGRMDNPNYGNIGDHTETVQVDYDPERITYNALLDIFWQNHKPTGRSWSRQYMNAVFYHDDRQRQMAMDSKAAVEKKIGRSVKTEVVPLRSFTMAEDYHQKYMLKQRNDLKGEMSRFYPLHRDFVDSTAVAHLNGYVGGHGSKDQLAREIDSLGLSASGRKTLTDMVNRKSNYDRQ
jgi:methionine-S-sulfoxide reductase